MTDLSPYDLVKTKYQFPFEARPKQEEAINALAPIPRAGIYMEVGTGKTFVSTVIALYKKMTQGNVTIVLAPPVLVKQWHRWLTTKVKGTTSVMYRGTPKQRKEIRLDADFIVMSIQIFKNDYQYLFNMFDHRPLTVLVDEATSIKNPASQNFRSVMMFVEGRDLMLLTGTPLSTPIDAYAYVKLVSPMVYRNLNHFEALHVADRDFFGKVTKWSMLELMQENLLLNSVRIYKREMLPYLKEPLYDPIEYDLSAKHYALYKELAEKQILMLEDGGKIDATVAQRLYHMLQQIICNPSHFSGDPKFRPAAYDLIDQLIDEVGAKGEVDPLTGKAVGRKLIISSTYQLTNRNLLEYLKPYGFVGFYGEISQKKQDDNADRFRDDPTCGGAVIQPQSGGYGLDGFQAVCSDVLFLEIPQLPKDFNQVVGRVDRDGQVVQPHIRIAKAVGTVQNRLYNNLLGKDALVNAVQGGWQDLRDAVFGN